jgi:hypothetical protein
MSALSTSLPGLLADIKYSLPRLWIWVQDRGIFSVGAILGIIVLYTARYFASPYRKLPPGPRGYPIIGNLFDMRGTGQWLKFSEWQKKYGEFVTSNLPDARAFPLTFEYIISRRSHIPQRSWPTGSHYQLSKSWHSTSRSTCGEIFRSTT